MKLEDILDAKTINIGLKNSNKDSVIKELATNLKNNGYIDNTEIFLDDVYKREAEGSTGIGSYIAIPHGKSSAVIKTGCAIGILDNEIDWETLDGNGVKVVILFSIGTNIEDSKTHLKLLSIIARKIGNDEVVERLVKSTTVDDVIKSFTV